MWSVTEPPRPMKEHGDRLHIPTHQPQERGCVQPQRIHKDREDEAARLTSGRAGRRLSGEAALC